MAKSKIISVLAEQEPGMSISEVCRRHGMSSTTFYKWKEKFGVMGVYDARRLIS